MASIRIPLSRCAPNPAAFWLHRLRASLFARHWAGKTRRFLHVHFRPGYVSEQLAARGGSCLRCGRCCTLAFTCPLFLQDRSCAAYDLPRPKACRAFPIDERDLRDVTAAGGNCGYWFREESMLEENTGSLAVAAASGAAVAGLRRRAQRLHRLLTGLHARVSAGWIRKGWVKAPVPVVLPISARKAR